MECNITMVPIDQQSSQSLTHFTVYDIIAYLYEIIPCDLPVPYKTVLLSVRNVPKCEPVLPHDFQLGRHSKHVFILGLPCTTSLHQIIEIEMGRMKHDNTRNILIDSLHNEGLLIVWVREQRRCETDQVRVRTVLLLQLKLR